MLSTFSLHALAMPRTHELQINRIVKFAHRQSIVIATCPDSFASTIIIPQELANTIIKGTICCAVRSPAAKMTAEQSVTDPLVTYILVPDLIQKLIQTLRSMIANEEVPMFCSHLILDDFHNASTEAEIALCLWLAADNMWINNKQLPRPPTLILMSRAKPTDRLIGMFPTRPYIVDWEATSQLPRKITHHKDCIYTDPDSVGLYIRAARIALHQFRRIKSGNCLVIVPRLAEAILVKAELGIDVRMEILHADSTLKELTAIYDTTRKIIIATPVVESDISLRCNIAVCIDTQTQPAIFHPDESLDTVIEWQSIDSSKRRQSIPTGVFIQLQPDFLHRRVIAPEIVRTTIYGYIADMIEAGLHPKNILEPALDRYFISVQVSTMKNLGLIQEKKVNSQMMSFCRQLPFNIRKSAMAYHLHQQSEMIDHYVMLLALVSTVHAYGSGLILEGTDFAGYSDIDTIINIWIQLFQINLFDSDILKAFCSRTKLSYHNVSDIIATLESCLQILDIKTDLTKLQFNPTEISQSFYDLLAVTHADMTMNVYEDITGAITAVYQDEEHKINTRSLHTVRFAFEFLAKDYYVLKRSENVTRRQHVLRIVDIFHAIPHVTT